VQDAIFAIIAETVFKNDLPVFVNESVECESIAPASGEVAYIDIRIASCFHLTP